MIWLEGIHFEENTEKWSWKQKRETWYVRVSKGAFKRPEEYSNTTLSGAVQMLDPPIYVFKPSAANCVMYCSLH